VSRAFIVVLAALLDGCYTQLALDGCVTPRGLGAGFEAQLGDRAVRAVVDYVGIDEGNGATTFYGGGAVSGSLLAGVVRKPPSLTSWIDIGADLGVGAGAHAAGAARDVSIAGWAGAWLELGLGSRPHDYPTLHLELRQLEAAGAVPSTTAFILALGWTWPNVQLIAP
jgi:hypothetical protein